jgi:nucleotide-binding universal stress UspA family protein
MATAAMQVAQAEGAALVVSFVREVALSYKVEAETQLTLDNDPAAQALFTDFLEHGHRHGVPVIPAYDTGHNAPELIAELAAINGVQKVLIGSSRRGAIHHMIKGSFQRRLEGLLPPEIPVQVLAYHDPAPPRPEETLGAGPPSAEVREKVI